MTEKPGEYIPFKIEKRPETLEIRLTPDDGEIFDYMLVKNTSYRLSKSPQRITVYTSAGRLVLTGRNLRELVEGFRRRSVAYVQEFDALHFAAISDALPCIDKIDFWPLDGKKPKAGASSLKDDSD